MKKNKAPWKMPRSDAGVLMICFFLTACTGKGILHRDQSLVEVKLGGAFPVPGITLYVKRDMSVGELIDFVYNQNLGKPVPRHIDIKSSDMSCLLYRINVGPKVDRNEKLPALLNKGDLISLPFEE